MKHEKLIRVCEYGRLIASIVVLVFAFIGSIGRIYKLTRDSKLVNAMEEAAETEE